MKNVLRKLAFFAIASQLIFACSKNKNSAAPDAGTQSSSVSPQIKLLDVSANGCLNIEKVMNRLRDPQFTYPAAIMHTNLKPITQMSQNKVDYFTHTNFYYRTGVASDLNLIHITNQDECKTLQLTTASREVLNFKVTDSSETHIQFQLSEVMPEEMRSEKKESFKTRIQPYEYTITWVDENSLRIVEKFRTLDPLCDTKDTLKFEVTKQLNWRRHAADLPAHYDVNSTFLTSMKTTLATPPAVVEEATIDSDSSITVDHIRTMMATPIRNELKLCI